MPDGITGSVCDRQWPSKASVLVWYGGLKQVVHVIAGHLYCEVANHCKAIQPRRKITNYHPSLWLSVLLGLFLKSCPSPNICNNRVMKNTSIVIYRSTWSVQMYRDRRLQGWGKTSLLHWDFRCMYSSLSFHFATTLFKIITHNNNKNQIRFQTLRQRWQVKV